MAERGLIQKIRSEVRDVFAETKETAEKMRRQNNALQGEAAIELLRKRVEEVFKKNLES